MQVKSINFYVVPYPMIILFRVWLGRVRCSCLHSAILCTYWSFLCLARSEVYPGISVGQQTDGDVPDHDVHCLQLHLGHHDPGDPGGDVRVRDPVLGHWPLLPLRLGRHRSLLPARAVQVAGQLCSSISGEEVRQEGQDVCHHLLHHPHQPLLGHCGLCSQLGPVTGDGSQRGHLDLDHLQCLHLLHQPRGDQGRHLDQRVPGLLHVVLQPRRGHRGREPGGRGGEGV